MNERSLPEMRMYFQRLGYEVADLNKLNIIHVAGTKGKGSTCSFIESIMRESPMKKLRVGFYSSPHLVEVRERIRIDGMPLSKPQFARYFSEVYGKLEKNKVSLEDNLPMPSYFRFLTLMAMHVFIQENVDIAILEVGIGGEYDATNIVASPAVCAITSLGFDHQAILGQTLAEIAWHKAGIMKTGVTCVTTKTNSDCMQVLEARSREKNCKLLVAEDLLAGFDVKPFMGIAGGHQESNALVAALVSSLWFNAQGYQGFSVDSIRKWTEIPANITRGLRKASWPGRSQQIELASKVHVFLDGAHTPESIRACAEWFKDVNSEKEQAACTVLIFYCSAGRNASTLLEPLSRITFDYAYFPLNRTSDDSRKVPEDLMNNMVASEDEINAQKQACETWNSLNEDVRAVPTSSIEQALISVNSLANDGHKVRVLVTGSLHLIGGVLHLQREKII